LTKTGRTGGFGRRRGAWLAAPLAVLALLLVAIVMVVSCSSSPPMTPVGPGMPSSSAVAPTRPAPSTTASVVHAAPPGAPLRVWVPRIGVDAKLVSLALQADGSMEVPPWGLAGWYRLGPKPGAPGPAVIAAHVDSKRGPDVFYRLGELQRGDRVHIDYANGRSVTFAVQSREMTAKSALPVKRIWNQTSEPVLRLITCGGDFNRQTGHYQSNVIVYASLVG